MAKVYIVSSGEYSDYRIEAVFSTRKNAKAYCALGRRGRYGDTPEIETWELDPDMKDIRAGKTVWLVRFTPAGKFLQSYLPGPNSEVSGPHKDVHGNLYWTVRAKDQEGAIKVAHDHWSGWKASQVVP